MARTSCFIEQGRAVYSITAFLLRGFSAHRSRIAFAAGMLLHTTSVGGNLVLASVCNSNAINSRQASSLTAATTLRLVDAEAFHEHRWVLAPKNLLFFSIEPIAILVAVSWTTPLLLVEDHDVSTTRLIARPLHSVIQAIRQLKLTPNTANVVFPIHAWCGSSTTIEPTHSPQHRRFVSRLTFACALSPELPPGIEFSRRD